jgi:hypothetical protein
MKRNLLALGALCCLGFVFLVAGCECGETRCPPCPPNGQQVCEEVMPMSQSLNCPACKDQVIIYARDGGTEIGCTKCELADREKPIIECRPPKATPKASPCPPRPPCP